jgi:hypothetical protein
MRGSPSSRADLLHSSPTHQSGKPFEPVLDVSAQNKEPLKYLIARSCEDLRPSENYTWAANKSHSADLPTAKSQLKVQFEKGLD